MNLAMRRPEAVVLGNYLRGALARRGLTQLAVAGMLGTSHGAVYNWIGGRCLPSMEVAQRLAEIVGDERVLAMVRRARTGRCRYEGCGRAYEIVRKSRRLYCSNLCQGRAQHTQQKRDPRQDAIDAFCNACEPEGMCRMADCPLRAFSPLLFVPLRRAS